MTFGHAEMAQMMTESQSLITAIFVSTVCIGILLGSIIGLYRIVLEYRAADRSFKSEKSTKPVAAALTGEVALADEQRAVKVHATDGTRPVRL